MADTLFDRFSAAVADPARDGFSHTLRALRLSVALAAPAPLLAWMLALLPHQAGTPADFALALVLYGEACVDLKDKDIKAEVLDFIPAERMVSLEREIFPQLIPRGLFAFREAGYWSDAGTLPAYLEAQRLLLGNHGAGVAKTAEIDRARVEGDVLVGGGSFVEGRIGPNVVAGRRCRVGRASLRNAASLIGSAFHAFSSLLPKPIVSRSDFRNVILSPTRKR